MAKKDEPQSITIGINLVSSRQCLARCYYAKSSTCNCVCGGVNHGIENPVEELQQTDLFTDDLAYPRSQTINEFLANKTRVRSRELDFGVWWRDGRNYPTYRVSWIVDTGEVYALDQTEQRVEILGKVATEAEVERKLDGWAGICGLMQSLQWVRDKLAT